MVQEGDAGLCSRGSRGLVVRKGFFGFRDLYDDFTLLLLLLFFFLYLSLVCRQLECRMSRLCTLEDIPLVLDPNECGRFLHIHNKDRLPDSSHSTNVPVMFNQAGLHLVASQWRNMIHSKKKKRK